MKTLPKLAITGLNIGLDDACECCTGDCQCDKYDHCCTCEANQEAIINDLSKMSISLEWCDGYSSTLKAYDPETIFKWIDEAFFYFGDFTCTVYGETEDGKRIEELKDTLTKTEHLKEFLEAQL